MDCHARSDELSTRGPPWTTWHASNERDCMARQKVVHGDDLLYRFFVDLFESEPELIGVVPQLLVQSMAIWLPLDAYRHSPILLPWVVRDPTCRGSKARNIPDEWGSPNGDGFFRDDNSLVKSVPRSLNIRGPKGSRLNGRRMGSEFVAAHIWRKVDSDRLASRIPLLNTFVPNLVWLPSQVSKLGSRGRHRPADAPSRVAPDLL